MNIKGIGAALHGPSIEGDLDIFESRLDYYRETGVEYLELPSHGIDIILNGQFNRFRLDAIMKTLNKFEFKYSIHPANDLNLCDVKGLAMQRELFLRNLEFAHMVGAEIVVYHSGVRLPYEEDRALDELMEIEREELFRLGEKAKELGVSIAVENHNPHRRDIDRGGSDKYGLFLDRLLKQIRIIDHANVGICLDYGHAYLSASHYNYDVADAIQNVLPYVNHLHIHDNFGIVPTIERPYVYQYNYGEDDLHLPIGWGSIPYSELLRLESKPVIGVVELKPRYLKDTNMCIKELNQLLQVIRLNA